MLETKSLKKRKVRQPPHKALMASFKVRGTIYFFQIKNSMFPYKIHKVCCFVPPSHVITSQLRGTLANPFQVLSSAADMQNSKQRTVMERLLPEPGNRKPVQYLLSNQLCSSFQDSACSPAASVVQRSKVSTHTFLLCSFSVFIPIQQKMKSVLHYRECLGLIHYK